MADRYYICPIIGSGSEANPFRAKVADAANVQRVSSVIKSEMDGKPTHRWTLCRVAATDFSAVEAMTGVIHLGSRTKLAGVLTNAQKQAVKTKLQAWGEDIDAGDIRLRDLILRLIKRHYAHVEDVLEAFP
jgi:hypothetical protein